ncbi:aldolase [Oceanobacillus neutriphilus]|uniref:Aldolase n=1 Tax=Oceanobacillus neutriphilus TaxID=531815 RepID=A0ABQ2NYU1_9BACI|nr:aldolase [Oceanobacillus neutriphilus]GGP14015.1 hypothetical protein GCM10011346_36300 [Oceanobacillus neutriphilus]
MFETSKIHSYRAFGLNILSDFPLPELIPVSCENFDEADLTIKETNLSSLWSKLAEPDAYYYIKKNFCMIKVPGVAIYRIEDGRTISFSAIEGSNNNQIRLYMLGTCLGVLLMQRKTLPIHGSCIVINEKAYAVVGDSGAGKSTLASAFLNRGFPLLTDDIMVVTLSEDNIPLAIPSYPQQKLWQESLDHFGMESNQFKPIYNRETKFNIPVNDHFVDRPIPLAGIFVLSEANQNDIEIASIPKLARFPVLFHNTYRNFMINRSELLDWHFAFSANLANNLDFYRIIRPVSRFTANELVDYILRLITKDTNLNDKKAAPIYQKGEIVI